MRAGAVVATLLVLALTAGSGVASAQSPGPGGQAPYVAATIAAFLQQDRSGDTSRFRQLGLVGVRPGSVVRVACAPACRGTDRAHTAGADGVVDLFEHVRGLRQRAGNKLTLTTTQPDQRSRTFEITVRTPRPSVINTSCFDPTGARASCTVTCPDSISANCEGAGLGLPRVVVRHRMQLTRDGRTRVRQLRATNLPARSLVSVWCAGDAKGCWHGVRVFYTPAGGTLSLRGPFTSALRPGARAFIRVQLDNRVRIEFGLRFRLNQGPAARSTCGSPTAFVLPTTPKPVRCRDAA